MELVELLFECSQLPLELRNLLVAVRLPEACEARHGQHDRRPHYCTAMKRPHSFTAADLGLEMNL
jgi:hypothetical protein